MCNELRQVIWKRKMSGSTMCPSQFVLLFTLENAFASLWEIAMQLLPLGNSTVLQKDCNKSLVCHWQTVKISSISFILFYIFFFSNKFSTPIFKAESMSHLKSSLHNFWLTRIFSLNKKRGNESHFMLI